MTRVHQMFLRMCLFVAVVAVFMTPCGATEDAPIGIVAEKPADGVAIQVENGWMVPYEMTIPGTEVRFRMVPVPGGEFRMGSPASEPGRKDDEGPQRTFVVEPFWMGETEITWAEYKVFMELYRHLKEFQTRGVRAVTDANRIDAVTAPTPLYEPDFTYEFGEDPQQPAVSMTQYAAKQYTKWLSAITSQQFRLPTEAEWEYACRAGSNGAFSFGNDESQLGDYAWFKGNTEESGTKHVRQKKPNAFGLYDMHGNVAEWVLDGYAPYKASDGSLNAATDWVRTDLPDPRVVRGGSFQFAPNDCRSSSRLGSDDTAWKEYDPNRPRSPWWYTTDPARGVGFRLLRPVKSVPRDAMEEFWKIDSEDIQLDVGDRLAEGRGVLGVVDKDLPAAIKSLSK